MLEHDGVLLTWALEVLPQPWADALGLGAGHGPDVAAIRLPNHRPHYLQYEGPISGNRGVVRRVGAGEYRLITLTPTSLQWGFGEGTLPGEVHAVQRAGATWQFHVTGAHC